MPSVHSNTNFRKKIASLLLDPYWCVRFASLMSHEYFETDVERDSVKAILQYYEAYKKPPVDPIDIVALAGDHTEDYIYALFDTDWYDKKLASDTVVTFIKEQKLKIAILDSVDDINKGKTDTILKRIKTVMDIGDSIFDGGIDFKQDADSWLADLWTNKISTGWPHIDARLDGGASGGELGIIISPSNRGKTMSLINVGYGAATLGSGKNVVHWTGEIHPKVVAKRYGARMMHRFIRRDDNWKLYRDELLIKARKLLPGNIRIFGGTKTSLLDLEQQLDAYMNDGYIFDEVIVDYIDLLKPPRRYEDRRFELTDISEGLRELAQKYNVPIWSASQSNRASYSKEVIDLQDIAEDIGKVNTADIIITLSQTKDEYSNNRCRLYTAKIRDGKRIVEPAYAKYYTDSQAIITIGE